MYIVKNAWRNLLRAKGRNILIGLIVCIIALSSCIALIIMESADNTAKDGLNNLDITATIGVDREKLMSDATKDGTDPRDVMTSVDPLTLKQMKTYATSDQVKDFYYTMTSSASATSKLDAVETSNQSFGTPGSDNQSQGPAQQSDSGDSGKKFTMGDFTLLGVSSADAMTSFSSGTYTISDGAVFEFGTNNKECVISKELATLNGIEVGDKIKVANPEDSTQKFTLKVTGIFTGSSDATANQQGGGLMASMDPSNQIYTNYETLKAIVASTADSGKMISSVQGTYVVGSPTAYKAFKTDVSKLGLSDEYTVSSNDLTSYENSLLPLTNLKKFATVLLALVLGIGGVLLTLFSIFIIRERKYEVGVLTAIGMKKKNVALQFLTEAFLVALIGVIVGTGIGGALSKPVANTLLADQISSIQEQQTDQKAQFGRDVGGGPGGSGGQTATVGNYIDTLSPTMDLSVVMSLAGICIFLSLVASVAALVFVMRFEPMRILSERE